MSKNRSPLTDERRKVFWIPAAAALPEVKSTREGPEKAAQHPARLPRSYRLPASLSQTRHQLGAAE